MAGRAGGRGRRGLTVPKKKIVDVAVIIPDASPVLTLARIGRLDLLLTFQVPVTIVDQVEYEIERNSAEAHTFIRRNANCIIVTDTLVGRGFRTLKAEDPRTRSRNLGEQAVDEYARSLVATTGPSFVPLVLFEDPDVLETRISAFKRAHLMNTTAWLYGMYELGVLPEAPELIERINTVRKTPMQPFEKTGRTKKMISAWKRKIVDAGS